MGKAANSIISDPWSVVTVSEARSTSFNIPDKELIRGTLESIIAATFGPLHDPDQFQTGLPHPSLTDL
jgi:hypothetical protein